jgi:DNA-binding transcriptional regulator YiaG
MEVACGMLTSYYAAVLGPPLNILRDRNDMKRAKLKKVDPRKLRESLGLNQTEFWARIEVTQSGGSRYERGREMPRTVRRLLGLIYLKEKL